MKGRSAARSGARNSRPVGRQLELDPEKLGFIDETWASTNART
jgi:hypothetical protein